MGSAPLLIQRGFSESLAGRFQTTLMPHWSFSEMRDGLRLVTGPIHLLWRISRRGPAHRAPGRVGKLRTALCNPLCHVPNGSGLPLDMLDSGSQSGGEMAALPKVLPWDQRAKSVDALPGGYTNHFRSLSKIAARVDETRPTPSELIEWFSPEFNYNPYGTRIIIGFLRRAGLIDIEDGSYSLTSWTRRWLEERDDRLIVALIHSKCRFVGEMLTELSGGRDKEQLLAVARDRYNMNWETTGPLTHRRGWLHSAGLLDSDPEGTWKTTSKGLELASRMELFDPDSRPHAQRRESDDKMGTSTDTGTAEDQVGLVESEDPTDLANEIIDSATDTTDHRRFERAVREMPSSS